MKVSRVIYLEHFSVDVNAPYVIARVPLDHLNKKVSPWQDYITYYAYDVTVLALDVYDVTVLALDAFY